MTTEYEEICELEELIEGLNERIKRIGKLRDHLKKQVKLLREAVE